MAILKVESSDRGQDIVVSVRGRERFWNRTFLTAFALAVSLHLGGLLLFRIAPIKLSWNSHSTAPAIVQAEFSTDGIAIALSDNEDLPERYVPPPALTVMGLPTLPTRKYVVPFDMYSINDDSHPFAELELALLEPWRESPPPLPKEPLTLQFSGPLAGRVPLHHPAKDWVPPAARSLKGAYRVVIDVKVDEQTGQIFWHNILTSSGVVLLDREALAVLKDMRLSPGPQDAFVTDGFVELTFLFGETT